MSTTVTGGTSRLLVTSPIDAFTRLRSVSAFSVGAKRRAVVKNLQTKITTWEATPPEARLNGLEPPKSFDRCPVGLLSAGAQPQIIQAPGASPSGCQAGLTVAATKRRKSFFLWRVRLS
jgi:hypothetical protein